MKKFKDNKGREWDVEINVRAMKQVRDALGVNLYGAMNDHFAIYTKVVADPVLLVDVLYCLCREQADARGVSDQEFGRAMGGDSLGGAADAFTQELIDFFPDGQIRQLMRATLAKAAEAVAILVKMASEAAGAVNASAVATTLSAKSTESLEPSELTPAV